MPEYTRRSTLIGAGIALSGSTILQSEPEESVTATPSEGSDAWPQHHYDAQNSNATSNVTGPTADYLSEREIFTQENYGFPAQPTVVDGTLYTVSEDVGGLGVIGSVVAIDVADGSVEWTNGEELPAQSPAVSDGTVYASGWNGTFALDAETGSVQWHREDVQMGRGSSPTVSEGTVIIPGTTALDTDDGSTKWRFENASTVTVADGTLVTLSSDEVLGVDIGSTAVRWRFDVPEYDTASKPVVGPENAYFRIYHEALERRPSALYALDLETGEQQWTISEQSPYEPEAIHAVTDETLLVSSHRREGEDTPSALAAHDTENGDVRWRSRPLEGRVSVANSRIYSLSRREDGEHPYTELVVGDLDTGETVTRYWEAHLGSLRMAGYAYPTVADGIVYFGTDTGVGPMKNSLYAIEAGDSEPSDELPEPTFEIDSDSGRPFLVGETLYLVDPGASETEIQLEGEKPTLQLDYDDDDDFEIVVPDAGISYRHENTSWSYDDSGTHTVTVRVRDKYGRAKSTSKTIEVYDPDEFPPLGEAEITISNEDGQTCTRTFEADITGEYSGELEYTWRLFEDGTYFLGESERRWRGSFDRSESIVVRLRVEDTVGRTATAETSFEIP